MTVIDLQEKISKSYHFRIFPALLVLFIAIVTCSCRQSRDMSRVEKPNIILIMADDLGYGDLSCYGNMAYSTPNIDQLADEGMRFTDYHSNGAVCSPTRAALMTGRYQQRSGIGGVVTAAGHRHTGLDLAETTIAEVMKANGYATAIFGKWHLGYDPQFNPVRQGFDEFRGFVSGNVDYHSHIDQTGIFDWWNQDGIMDDEGYSTDLITGYGMDFLDRNYEKPFFLYLAHEAPHYPYQGRGDSGDRTVGGTFNNLGSRKDVGQAYMEMMTALDQGVGAIKQKVLELGIEKNTLILFISDNGANPKGSNGSLRGSKGTLWEGGHRVPMLAWWPGKIEGGQSTSCMALSMDLFPTILALSSIKQEIDLDGIDISNILFGQNGSADRMVFWRFKDWRCVREGPWKLLINKNERFLFNLDEDLNERVNLIEEEENTARHLYDALLKWEAEVDKNVKRRT
jgi:arylsulfatase A-like enzyme